MFPETSSLYSVQTLLRYSMNTGEVTHLNRSDIDEIDIEWFAGCMMEVEFLGDPRTNQLRVFSGSVLGWKTLAMACQSTLYLHFIDDQEARYSRLCVAIGESSGKLAWKGLTMSDSEPLASSWCAVRHREEFFFLTDDQQNELIRIQKLWTWAWLEYCACRNR